MHLIYKVNNMKLSDRKDIADKLKALNLRAFLFDMDGVLFDSMSHHAKAWVHALTSKGFEFNEYEAYMREGMTGSSTINDVYNRQLGHGATEEECQEIYKIKSDFFETLGEAKPMANIIDVLQFVKSAGIDIHIVTGSGQRSLLNRLNHHFPGFFSPDKMVTAFDVKKGKPDPEPYLMALQKGGLTAEQVIVVENAPLGVLSAKAAGLFTVAVNTGILKDEELLSRGVDLLYGNMREFADDLPNIFRCSNNV